MESSYKELTYEEALEFYNRWGRTILVGSSPTDYYEFNKLRDKKSLDDCIKQYLNYYDGPVRFFLNQRTIDHDMQLNSKNESKNMNKKHIRLTEQDLHRIVKESVNKILKEASIDNVFDGMPHTYTVDLCTKSEGNFGYAFSNIRNYEELDAAIRERFPDVLNWRNPRRNKPFKGWH